jgi:hypothetical protein
MEGGKIMANAFKCDRCGEFFMKPDDVIKYPCIHKNYYGGKLIAFDLCDKCQKDLELFMQNTPLVVNKEERKPMTCREKLAIEHPEYIGKRWLGGCYGCPHEYGYIYRPDYCSADDDNSYCEECWDRPVETK